MKRLVLIALVALISCDKDDKKPAPAPAPSPGPAPVVKGSKYSIFFKSSCGGAIDIRVSDTIHDMTPDSIYMIPVSDTISLTKRTERKYVTILLQTQNAQNCNISYKILAKDSVYTQATIHQGSGISTSPIKLN